MNVVCICEEGVLKRLTRWKKEALGKTKNELISLLIRKSPINFVLTLSG